jgi:hypothetical protein
MTKIAAQGDMLIIRVDEIPPDALLVEETEIVLAHSETGHHHVFEGRAQRFRMSGDELTSYLRVTDEIGHVVHRRSWDTHAPISLPAGDYMIRRQREWTPEGWRRVED